MNYQTFVRSEFDDLTIGQVLTSKPSVLLGLDAAAETAIATLGIHTVFDLSVSTTFDGAARLVASSDSPRSAMRRYGRGPSSLVNAAGRTVDTANLPDADIAVLAGLDTATATALGQALSVAKVRDLAYWPPFLAAKAIMLEAYNPSLDLDVDPEAPLELIPKSGELGTERHLYSTVVMFPGKFGSEARSLRGVLFDTTAPPGVGFDTLRYGARLTYSHNWTPLGTAKGHLLHSLPLAPGESTNVAVIDWTSKSSASTRQSLSESERLDSSNDRARTVSQIADSVAREFTSGSSVTTTESTSAQGGVGGILSLFTGSMSTAVNQQVAVTHTVSTGERDIATSLQQNIQDATQQASSSMRNQRAATVSEINQAQSESLATRSVTNYNHMHALTVQYYEVVQLYETETHVESAERCIFLPMQEIDFRDERNIVKYLPILKATALDGHTRTLLAALEESTMGYTLRFRGATTRFQAVNASPFPFLELPPLADLFSPQIQADARALARDGFITFTGNLDDLTLDVRLLLNSVRWRASRTGQAPLTPITGVDILLEDGTRLALAQSAADDAAPSAIDPALNGGEALSFGRILGIAVQFDPAYVPAAYPWTTDGHLIRLELGIGLGDDARWLDCSFLVNASIAEVAPDQLYTVKSPPALAELGQALHENGLYYSQQVWLHEDPQARIMQLAPFAVSIGGGQTVNLVDHLSPQPLTVVGNYLVYRFTYEDAEWRAWEREHADPTRVSTDTVAVPTGGVFAEAVLGRANAAEKLDITRFFDWADSPPPAPPALQPLTAGKHTPTAAPAIGTFDAPMVQLQAPLALPEPVGLSSLLTAITISDAFRNMSGLSASGDAANQALDASGAAATSALQAAGTALATTLDALADGLSAKKPADKTLSEAGAAINQKAIEAKATEAAAGNGTAPSGPDKVKADLVLKALKDLGIDLTPTPTPSTETPPTTGLSDPALLESVLVTEPTFANVLGFVRMLQLLPDSDLIPAIAMRFSSLGKTVDPLQKYHELVAVITANSATLENPGRMLYAARFLKAGTLPEDGDFTTAEVAGVRTSALDIAVRRTIDVARTVNGAATAPAALTAILSTCGSLGVTDLDEVSYVLATAHHESAMGRYTTELGNGASTDTVFTRDAYFFEAIPGKKSSYNTLAGNKKAGTALKAAGVIGSNADVSLWNGTVYPDAQPAAVKLAARACDFFVFIGRGYVQVTGRANYQKFSGLPALGGVDLVGDPPIAATPDIAAKVLVLGMRDGMFRPHKLADYALPAGWDATHARDIVNGDGATYGAKLREIAKRYKETLVQFPKLDESRRLI